MPKYFGTDGIRGIPFNYPLTKTMIENIGFSISRVLNGNKKVCFIARDTRNSGKKIVRLISKGINLSGVDVYDLGIITTPALSYIVSFKKPSFGIMISASHNPPQYNGIKVFDSSGQKISEEIELRIEKVFDETLSKKISFNTKLAISKKIEFKKLYIDYVLNLFKGIKTIPIALDCSNGSLYKIAPYVFKKLGFKFSIIGNKPNGENINVGCGALDLKNLKKLVLKEKLSCGVSYDGDGDRCLIVDENGEVVDGDDIIAAFVYYYLNRGILRNKTVVLTYMSNYGLVKFLSSRNLNVILVDVGDRNVYEAMKKYGAIIGGETSGHVILSHYLNTGDGLITSLEFLRLVSDLGMKVSQVKKIWNRYPSLLRSFKIDKKIPFQSMKNFKEFIKKEEKRIEGRIFIRYSGTEPLLRILVEANHNEKILEECVRRIYDAYRKEVLQLN